MASYNNFMGIVYKLIVQGSFMHDHIFSNIIKHMILMIYTVEPLLMDTPCNGCLSFNEQGQSMDWQKHLYLNLCVKETSILMDEMLCPQGVH